MPWNLFWTIVVQALVGTAVACICWAMIKAAIKPEPKDPAAPGGPGALERLRARRKAKDGDDVTPVAQ